jgi:regulatory protein
MSASRAGKPEDRARRGSHEPVDIDLERAKEPAGKIMAAALKILAARSRSEGELREKLISKGWAETKLIEECIGRLKDLHYVDDDSFAQSYARYRISLKPVGKARLARELSRRKVPQKSVAGAIELVFGEVSEETLIDRAIERHLRTHGRPADRAAAKRMFNHLGRLGFEYDLISRKIRAIKPGIEDGE